MAAEKKEISAAAAAELKASASIARFDEATYVSLELPQKEIPASNADNRVLVFVIDTSGSMAGSAIRAVNDVLEAIYKQVSPSLSGCQCDEGVV